MTFFVLFPDYTATNVANTKFNLSSSRNNHARIHTRANLNLKYHDPIYCLYRAFIISLNVRWTERHRWA